MHNNNVTMFIKIKLEYDLFINQDNKSKFIPSIARIITMLVFKNWNPAKFAVSPNRA